MPVAIGFAVLAGTSSSSPSRERTGQNTSTRMLASAAEPAACPPGYEPVHHDHAVMRRLWPVEDHLEQLIERADERGTDADPRYQPPPALPSEPNAQRAEEQEPGRWQTRCSDGPQDVRLVASTGTTNSLPTAVSTSISRPQ